MLEGQDKLTKSGVSILSIGAATVSLVAMLAILSCTADSSESGKTASTGPSASSGSAAPAASAPSIIIGGPPPTPAVAPTGSAPFDGRPVSSSPPDTTDYSKPARPGDRMQ